jgi:UDP-glucose 4-epimerase
MHIFVTGVTGQLGRSIQSLLLSQGHSITGCDVVEPSGEPDLPEGSIFVKADMCDYRAVEAAIKRKPCDAVVHLAAIRSPDGHDQREVHNVNVVSSYNVLRTAADLGIRRMVQASSVNATGLAYTKEEHQHFDELPLHEKSPMRPEEAYSQCHINVRSKIPKLTAICMIHRLI